MKIKLNESKTAIEIKDGSKNQYLVLKILMALNLTNALIRVLEKQITQYGFIEIFWVGIAIVSLLVLIILQFTMSTAEKIPIEEISGIEEKIVFGKHKFSLKLKNGKKRNIGNFKDQFDFVKTREFFTNLGITN